MNSHKFKGFTPVKLLIFVALLGALAVLLIALDPFEQLKKGADVGVRNTASELQAAIIKYYGIKNQMPWCATADSCVDPVSLDISSTDGKTMIDRIMETGELGNDFKKLIINGSEKIFVTGINTNVTVAVCFKPLSKSFAFNENTKYTKSGVTPNGNCPTGYVGGSCYWCIK